jgi:hypothetical protein
VLFVLLALGSGTTEKAVQDDASGTRKVPVVYTEIPFSDLRQSIENIDEPHGFILDAFIGGDSNYIMLCDSPIENRFSPPRNTIYLSNAIRGKDWEDITKRYDKNILCKVYIEVYSSNLYNATYNDSYVVKIEGLLTPEQVAQRKAEEKAADEEANRYDASKFTVVPSDFRPTSYTSIDLFTAVSNVEKMPRGDGGAVLFGIPLNSLWYVSDVVFVNQNGTDIQFRTADNAISQIMKVDSRSGLTSGQRVRLYYRVSKNPLTEWRVVAIERL